MPSLLDVLLYRPIVHAVETDNLLRKGINFRSLRRSVASGSRFHAATVRSHQPHLVAHALQLERPVVSTATSLNADQGKRQVDEERGQLVAPQLLLPHHLAMHRRCSEPGTRSWQCRCQLSQSSRWTHSSVQVVGNTSTVARECRYGWGRPSHCLHTTPAFPMISCKRNDPSRFGSVRNGEGRILAAFVGQAVGCAAHWQHWIADALDSRGQVRRVER